MNLINKQTRNSFSWYIPLLVACSTVSIVVTIGYSLWKADNIIRKYSSQMDATMMSVYKITEAHLWFEEIIGGDLNESIDTVWNNLDESQWYLDVMMEGGQNHESIFIKSTDPAMRQHIQHVQAELAEFRDIARERYDSKQDSTIGSEIDQHFDEVFKSFLEHAEHVEINLRKMMNTELSNFRIIQLILIAIVIGSAIAVGVVLYLSDLRKVQALQTTKLAKKEAELQHKNLESIFNAAPVGMLLISDDLCVSKVNDVMTEMVGKETAEIIGTQSGNGLGCIHSFDDKGGCGKSEFCNQCIFRNAIKSVLTSGQAVHGVEIQSTFLIDDNKVDLWLDINVEPVEMEGKRYVIVAANNITKRKHVEEKLEEANRYLTEATARANDMAAQAEMANISKSHFLANMSHEIRTPMNGIIGFSDILINGQLTGKEREYVNIIRNSGQNLLRLINDILDLSKIEAEKIDVEIIDCSLKEILNSIEPLIKAQVSEKSVEFQVVTADALPAQIRTDPIRLNQCLINLANNAIKFTDQGHVYVNVSLQEDNGESFIRFDVEDTGIGIPVEKQENIFEAFVQADGSTTREFGGTGLGLTITKQLAELMGGTLTLTSQTGKGSVFSLVIPTGVDIAKQPLLDMSNSANKPNTALDTEHVKFSGSVLVAEDDRASQMLIRLLLEKMGFEVTFSEDGAAAVQKATTQSFDLIFMDMQMPKMNGYEAARELRDRGVSVPIIALTANAMKGDSEKCIEAGCDGYLSKPIDNGELKKVLKKFIKTIEVSC